MLGRDKNPPAHQAGQLHSVRGDLRNNHQQSTDDHLRSLCLGDGDGALTRSGGSRPDDVTLRGLLAEVGSDPQGWRGRAGARIGAVIMAEATAIASRWRHAGGDVTGYAVGGAWEEVMRDRERLASDPDASPLAAIRSALSRWYATEVGAVQTGMGDPVRNRSSVRTIVAHCKEQGRLGVVDLDEALTEDAGTVPTASSRADGAPAWARAVALLLARQGWAWPASAVACLVAVDADTERSGRRRAPAPALLSTGVPSETWSALALLVAGSGPGCAIETSWPGAKRIFATGGGSALRESSEVHRLVDAAVAGRAVRSGRLAARATALVGAA